VGGQSLPGSDVPQPSTRGLGPLSPRGRFWALVTVVVVIGAFVRYWAIFVLSRPSRFVVSGDGLSYLAGSDLVARGVGYGYTTVDGTFVPDVLHPPLWVTYLGGVRWAIGADTAYALGVAAAALGLLTIALVAAVGRRIGSERTGLVAAALVAVSPAFWTYERNLNAEAVTYPLLALFLLLAYRYRARPSLAGCCLLGLTAGLLGLSRTEQLAAGGLVTLCVVLGTPQLDLAHRVTRVAVAAGLCLAVLAPWTIATLDDFERPVLVSAGAGNAMLAGACDITFSGEQVGSYSSNCVLKNPLVFAALTQDRTVADATARDEAITYTADHLDRLPTVLVARQARTWGFWFLGDQVALHSEQVSAPEWVTWVQIVELWALVPFAVAGTVLLRRRGTPVYPLLTFPALCVVSTFLTFGDIRYRAPAEIPLVLLAAAGIDLLLARRAGAPEDAADPVSEPLAG